jgi:phosphoribosylformimino-5-aminoimidazole carboxamide ribonucleotide (ProFAR) isomerase
MDDVVAAAAAAPRGIAGAIIGKALYEGRISLIEAVHRMRRSQG